MKLNKKIIAKKIQGETVLLNMENGDYFSLNALGAEVYECLSNGIQAEEIIKSLFKKYNVDLEILQKDVDSLIKKLIEKEIIINN